MIYSVKTINQKEKPGFFVYFIAKKKIFKKAVIRNKAKRVARHAFAEAKKEYIKGSSGTFPSKQVIFFLENGIIQESFQDIVNSFTNDLNKLTNKNNK